MKLPAEPPCGKDQHIESTVCSYPLVIGANPVDYSEYMWMGEEMEEFDRKVRLRSSTDPMPVVIGNLHVLLINSRCPLWFVTKVLNLLSKQQIICRKKLFS